RADPIQQLPIEAQALLGSLQVRGRNAGAHDQDVVSSKSQRHVLQSHKALDQKAGGRQQDDRQGDFGDHQRAPQAIGKASARAARVLLCLSDWLRSMRRACKAGARPKSTLAANEAAKANHSTRLSIAVSERRGTSFGASATSTRDPHSARSTPNPPASSARTTL